MCILHATGDIQGAIEQDAEYVENVQVAVRSLVGDEKGTPGVARTADTARTYSCGTCTNVTAPICARCNSTSNTTFSNTCKMNQYNCQNGCCKWTMDFFIGINFILLNKLIEPWPLCPACQYLYNGTCFTCPKTCTNTSTPVCASCSGQNKTFVNQCSLNQTNCNNPNCK